jgi:nuclear transport factor 2 (NTF2) superfamily protein
MPIDQRQAAHRRPSRWSRARRRLSAFRPPANGDTVTALPICLGNREHPGMSTSPHPRTIEEARAFVACVEALFMPWNIPALLDGFTDDCIVRFGDMPEFGGRAALEALFRARSERQRNYRLRKEFCALMDDTIANYWEGNWEDRVTGARMAGRGVEICVTAISPCGRRRSTSTRSASPAPWGWFDSLKS